MPLLRNNRGLLVKLKDGSPGFLSTERMREGGKTSLIMKRPGSGKVYDYFVEVGAMVWHDPKKGVYLYKRVIEPSSNHCKQRPKA